MIVAGGLAAHWSSRSVAIVMPCFVLTGAFPFLLGATLTLLALVALEARRWRSFGAGSALAAAAGPLACVLLAVVGRRLRPRRPVARQVARPAPVDPRHPRGR